MSAIRSLQNLIKIARIALSSSDSGKLPIQQVAFMGKTSPCLIVMPYGMHANLPVDSLLTILSCNADDGNLHGLPHIHDRIKNLKSGEVIFYHPITKSFIHFKNSGDIDIDSKANINAKCSTANIEASGDINETCSNHNITGNLNVTGNTAFTGSVTANGKTIDDTHTHDGPPTAPTGPKSPTGTVL